MSTAEKTKAVGGTFSSTRSLLDMFFSSVHGPGFSVDFWDGTRKNYGSGKPEFKITFTKEPGLIDLLSSPSLFFGEAYLQGEVDISGSFRSAAKALDAAVGAESSLKNRLFFKALSSLSSATRSLTQQKKDIAAHYDLGNDFFSLWLDKPTLSYSCAYFCDASDSLETAQQRKIDLVLRKLHLERGMRLLDIGCGWGGLALSAAKNYGARVLAITLSEEQASAAKQLYADHGVTDVCEVRLCNYLELDPEERFDRIASVGMFEHVGKEHYADFFGKVSSLLKTGGVSLLHTLTKNKPSETDPWIAKRIFPGGRIPAIAELAEQLTSHDFHLLHVESLRRHYVKTLDMWYENYSRPEVAARVQAMFDRAFVRMWGLYLRMASAFLATGGLDVHQFVFSKGVSDNLPMTLESIYSR